MLSRLSFSEPFYALSACGSGQKERNFFGFPKSKIKLCPVLGPEHIGHHLAPGKVRGAELMFVKQGMSNKSRVTEIVSALH